MPATLLVHQTWIITPFESFKGESSWQTVALMADLNSQGKLAQKKKKKDYCLISAWNEYWSVQTCSFKPSNTSYKRMWHLSARLSKWTHHLQVSSGIYSFNLCTRQRIHVYIYKGLHKNWTEVVWVAGVACLLVCMVIICINMRQALQLNFVFKVTVWSM